VGEPFAKSWPVKAMALDLTENCSLRCRYCFCGEKTQRNLSVEVGKAAIDWLLSPETSGKERELQVDLWGGEPMLRWPLAKELIAYGNRQAERAGKKIRWNMTTNGVHMTERTCQEVKLAGVSFMLSLDGGKETQDANRPLAGGGSSFDVIVKNIPHMKAVWGKLRVRMTVQEEHVGRMFEDMRYLHEELDIPEISHCLAHESAWGPDSMAELERQLRLIGDWYVERKLAGDEKLWVKFIDDGIARLLYPRPMTYFCGAGRSYLSVSVDGVIYPCHRFHEFTDPRPWQEQEWAMGTIYEGLVKPEVRQLFIRSNERKQGCQTCKLAKWGVCNGSCYAVNWVKSQNINLPAHSQCQEMHFIQSVAESVYNRLIGVPAFRPNLARMAREHPRVGWCIEPGFEGIPGECGIGTAQESVRVEIEVLQSALSALGEVTRAIQEVVVGAIGARKRQLELWESILPVLTGDNTKTDETEGSTNEGQD